MNYKTTLVLILLLAVVGGYFYFVEYGTISGYEAHQQQAEQGPPPQGDPLFADWAGQADNVTQITIRRAGKLIVIDKQDGHWFQTKPVRFRLNDYAPQNVVRQFLELRYLEKVTPGETDAPTPEDMGVDKPRAVLTVKTDDDDKSLRLGKLTLGGQGYVQVEGEDTVYVVSASLFGAVLDETINDWRSTSLDVPEAANAVQLSYEPADGEAFTLNKVDGRWRFDSRFRQRVSQDAVDQWFSEIGRLWIDEFVQDNPESLAIFGLDQPYLSLKVFEPAVHGEDTSQTLLIGGTTISGEKRYAAWTRGDEPVTVVFSVNAGSAEGLAKAVADLRDPKVIAADVIDVRRVVVEQQGGATLDLVRDLQSGYSFGEPGPGFDADYSVSHNMVKNLCELQSNEFVEQLDDLGEPAATVQIGLADGNMTSFAVYDRDGQRVVVNGGESIGYVVPAGALDTLLSPPLVYRERTILELDPGSIESLTLRRDDGTTFTFTPAGGDDTAGWSLEGTDEFEDQTFTGLVHALDPLRVERWLDGPVSPSAGWCQLTIQPTGGAPITLQADPATGRAVMTGVDAAFDLPAPLIDSLTAEYRRRTVLDIPMDGIESVRLASNANALTVSRDGMQYVSDAGELDQALAAATFDTLAALRAQRYVAPRTLRAEDIDYTLQLTTADGRVRTLLVVDDGGDSVTVTFDEPRGPEHAAWFSLSRAAFETLIGPLMQIESPTK